MVLVVIRLDGEMGRPAWRDSWFDPLGAVRRPAVRDGSQTFFGPLTRLSSPYHLRKGAAFIILWLGGCQQICGAEYGLL